MFEAVFAPHSYGFRPGRSARQAVQQAQAYIAEGNDWVVDIVIEEFLIVHLDASLKTQVVNGACFE
jgi:retron-type reverse transcriptase